jgi:hypothetical protein
VTTVTLDYYELVIIIVHSENQMSEGGLERAHIDQLHISCRIMLTQYMTVAFVAQIRSTSYHVLERASLSS